MQLRSLSIYPVYSRLSPFCLFPNLIINLRGENFRRNESIIHAANEYLGAQEEGFYFEGIRKGWRKCMVVIKHALGSTRSLDSLGDLSLVLD